MRLRWAVAVCVAALGLREGHSARSRKGTAASQRPDVGAAAPAEAPPAVRSSDRPQAPQLPPPPPPTLLAGAEELRASLGLRGGDAASCGVILVLSNGGGCASIADGPREPESVSRSRTARCKRIMATVHSLDRQPAPDEPLGFSAPDVRASLPIHHIDAGDPAVHDFASEISARSVRSDMAWAASSLPILWYFEPAQMMDIAPNPEQESDEQSSDGTLWSALMSMAASVAGSDTGGDLLWAALNFGEEIPDASSFSDVYLAEYINQLPKRKGRSCPPIRTVVSPEMPEAPMVLAGAIAGQNHALADQLITHDVMVSTPEPGCDADDWSVPCYSPVHSAFTAYDPMYDSHPPGEVALKVSKAAVTQLALLTTSKAEKARRRADHINLPGASGLPLLHSLLNTWAKSPTVADAESNLTNRLTIWIIDHVKGVNLGATDPIGTTVLHQAAKVHNFHVLQHILSKALSDDDPEQKAIKTRLINTPDKLGNTPLHSATGGAAWHPGLSKSLMFDTQSTFRHHTVFNNPAWHAGFENDCMERLRAQADVHGAGTFTELSEILSSCRFFDAVISLLLEHGASTSLGVANNQGETALHLAARGFDTATAGTLIRAAKETGSSGIATGLLQHKDERGLTALELAVLLGSPVVEVLCPEVAGCAGEPPQPVPWRPEQPQLDPGFSTPSMSSTTDPTESGSGAEWSLLTATEYETSACDIDRRVTLTAKEFEEEYVNQFKPVIISGAGAFTEPGALQELQRLWSRENLLRRHQSIEVGVGSIPYERDFRTTSADANTSHLRSRLGDYIQSMRGEGVFQPDGTASGRLFPPDYTPTYAFDRSSAALRMLHEVPELQFFNSSRMEQVSFQWYLGPSGSGANDHFHGHAFNVLVHGAKRWFLTPPPFAFYSSKTPLQWLASDYGALKDSHQILECMQRPGEVIYVPASWGHAVLNTAESIGYSGEFKAHRGQWLALNGFLDLDAEEAGNENEPEGSGGGIDRAWLAQAARARQFANLKKHAEGFGAQKSFSYSLSTGML